MSVWRDWIEEHWAGVGMAVSIIGALMVAVILAVAFNTVAMRLDGLHRDATNAAPPARNVRSQVSDSPQSGAI